jgi:hypothetical protein
MPTRPREAVTIERRVAPIPHNARSLVLGLPVALGLAACNFEVPSSSYLAETRLLSV